MLHTFDSTCSIVEQVVTGTEDGTPITEAWITWTGPCRKDDPTESVEPGKVATKVSQRTFIFVMSDCPVSHDGAVIVADALGVETVYRVQTVERITSPFTGPHHIEIGADRVVNA